MGADEEKRIAAEAAAELVEDGMTVGLGTGSTVAHLLPAIARRGLSGIRCVATSVATEEQARELGIPVEEFSELERLDIAIDGTDQVTPDGWLIKGGGAAHQREKIVAAAAERFVVIADSSKPVDSLSPPVPLELLAFGLRSTLARLGPEVELRDVPRSPDGGVIADYRGEIGDPAVLAVRLDADPGVSSHGLFPPSMVSEVLVGGAARWSAGLRPAPRETRAAEGNQAHRREEEDVAQRRPVFTGHDRQNGHPQMLTVGPLVGADLLQRIGHVDGLGLGGERVQRPAVEGVFPDLGNLAVALVANATSVPKDREVAGVAGGLGRRLHIGLRGVEEGQRPE